MIYSRAQVFSMLSHPGSIKKRPGYSSDTEVFSGREGPRNIKISERVNSFWDEGGEMRECHRVERGAEL